MNVLVKDELRRVTGFKYKAKQCEALDRMGIAYSIRPDGWPVVTEAALNKGTVRARTK